MLDGEFVEDDKIDPKKHIYIGSFRKPWHKFIGDITSHGAFGVLMCPCGQGLQTIEGTHSHWMQGHFDMSVYQTIKNPSGGGKPKGQIKGED
jgi:hypothetical protein